MGGNTTGSSLYKQAARFTTRRNWRRSVSQWDARLISQCLLLTVRKFTAASKMHRALVIASECMVTAQKWMCANPTATRHRRGRRHEGCIAALSRPPTRPSLKCSSWWCLILTLDLRRLQQTLKHQHTLFYTVWSILIGFNATAESCWPGWERNKVVVVVLPESLQVFDFNTIVHALGKSSMHFLCEKNTRNNFKITVKSLQSFNTSACIESTSGGFNLKQHLQYFSFFKTFHISHCALIYSQPRGKAWNNHVTTAPSRQSWSKSHLTRVSERFPELIGAISQLLTLVAFVKYWTSSTTSCRIWH